MYNSILTYMKEIPESFSAENSPSAKCKLKHAIIFIYILVSLVYCSNGQANSL